MANIILSKFMNLQVAKMYENNDVFYEDAKNRYSSFEALP